MMAIWSRPHWGQVTPICASKLIITRSDYGLSPGRHQAIIWTSAEILSIGTLGTNFSENFNEIHTFSFRKMHLKILSAKWRPFCLDPNMLTVSFSVGSDWCTADVQRTEFENDTCSNFVTRAGDGWNLDADQSGFTDLTEDELQRTIVGYIFDGNENIHDDRICVFRK